MKVRPSVQIFLAATVIALLLAAYIRFLRPAPPTLPREASLKELTLRDGKSYLKNELTPFTGIVIESYPDGSRKSHSYLSNGVMHGVSEGWHTNGMLQIREHFHTGVSHGLREKWYASGAKLSETAIKHGRIHGLLKRWHENGQLSEQAEFNEGEPQGISSAYDSDGSLKARVNLRDRMPDERFTAN